jgi:hypothetical protein
MPVRTFMSIMLRPDRSGVQRLLVDGQLLMGPGRVSRSCPRCPSTTVFIVAFFTSTYQMFIISFMGPLC